MDYTLANSESIIIHRGSLPKLMVTPQVLMRGDKCYAYQGISNDIAVYREVTMVFVA